MSIVPAPPSWPRVIPRIIVADAERLVGFLRTVSVQPESMRRIAPLKFGSMARLF